MRVALPTSVPSSRILVLWAALALTACGGSDEGAGAPAKVDRPAETAATSTPAATPAAAPASAPTAPTAKGPAKSEDPTGGLTVDENGVITSPREYEPSVDGPLVATFPEEKAPEPAPKIDDLPAADPVMGPPLVIGDRVIPFDQVKREICLGSFGMAEVELAKVRVFIDAEIRRRVEAGASREALSVSQAELDGMLADIQAQVTQDFPEGDYGMEEILGGIGGGDPRERVRTTRLFNKLFLPDDPADFPPVTHEAIQGQAAAEGILEHYQLWWDNNKDNPARKKGVAERTFDDTILSQVLLRLHETADLVRQPAPGILFRVNGVDIATEDIWQRLQPVSQQEVRRAKQWIVNSTLLEENLKKAGAWLSEADAAAAYEAYSAPYKDGLFSRENIALMIKRFPSVDRYKEYRRIFDSFHAMKKAEITQAVLDQHAQERTNKIVGQVAVDADVILCSAFDFRLNRWKDDGWEGAEKRMRDVIRLLVEEQRPWEEIVERYSEFVEPPIPVSERDTSRLTPRKGRFRNVQRNNLLGLLGETEYDLFLNGGESITDFLFFGQEVGTLGDPMRGPNGWYLPRLIRRTKAPQRVPMKPDDYQELLLEDYLTTELNEHARQLVHDGDVYGLGK